MAGAATDFDALFLAHYAGLCQLAYRMIGSRAVAEDLVQDLFLAVWARRGGADLTDPVPYLYTAVRNRAISHLRRERWRMSTLATRALELWRNRPDDDRNDAGDLASAIDRAIQELPQRRRQIFTLHREQHLSYAEIARTLDISIKTVETQMGRALKTLRTRLAPYLGALLLLMRAGW
jgi:RNA polymerase sigma-70 factor, ECF subfamily